MGTALNKEEQAIIDAGDPWSQLPHVVARTNQVRQILEFEGATFNADGLTRALQIWQALDAITPIESVVPWMKTTKQFPFGE